MRISFNNNSTPYTGYTYVIKGQDNKKVNYLYNKVVDAIKGKGIPATFKMGEDVITLSPESKVTAHSLKKNLKEMGIKLASNKTV